MSDEAAVLTAAQCRAARALIEWSVEELPPASHVGVQTIIDFEARFRAPGEDVRRRIREALEEGGVVFIGENGGGAGVRLKFSRREARHQRMGRRRRHRRTQSTKGWHFSDTASGCRSV